MSDYDDIMAQYNGPSTSDVVENMSPLDRPYAPAWNGLKQYLPNQPDWMKTLQQYAGKGVSGLNALSNAMPPGTFDAMTAIMPGPKSAVRVPNPIKAYHGSPHDFDAFDLSKIGTGEGAQAYGHGLYFAESEPVARSYRDQLAPGMFGSGVRPSDAEITADMHLRLSKGDYDGAIERARQALTPEEMSIEKSLPQPGGWSGWQIKYPYGVSAPYPSKAEAAAALRAKQADGQQRAAQTLDLLQQWKQEGKQYNPGHMYEVNLHASPEQFLDWDKPLAQQTPVVRGALDKAFETVRGKPTEPDFYGAFGERGSGLYNLASTWQKYHPEGNANMLQDAGIPGIRYLDQGSRAKGDGTRNYAVWDPRIIEIMRKYAVPPIVAAGLLAQHYSSDGQAQQ